MYILKVCTWQLRVPLQKQIVANCLSPTCWASEKKSQKAPARSGTARRPPIGLKQIKLFLVRCKMWGPPVMLVGL